MKNQPVVIIKKAGHAKHGHHGGAWKVAYADFVTAMMALFIGMLGGASGWSAAMLIVYAGRGAA